jgi:tRNA(His) 5'-end guanylyltransferase
MRTSQPGKYDAGDVISVLPDGAQLGLMEDLDQWEAAGHPASSFPGTFYVVTLEGMTVEQAQAYLEGEEGNDNGNKRMVRRRKFGVNVTALERRTEPERQTLFTRFKITRDWNDNQVKNQFKAK